MPYVEAGSLSPRDRHHLLLSTVVPRPIAWVSTIDTKGRPNLAPFSFFNGVSATPPLVSISVGHRRDGSPKDTLANIQATREFVVHIVDEAHAHVMVETSVDAPPGEDEAALLGIPLTPSRNVKTPRVRDAPLAMECRLVDLYRPSERVGLVVGEVLAWHVKEGLIADTTHPVVDVHRLRPVARLGGELYSPIREVFTMERPRA